MSGTEWDLAPVDGEAPAWGPGRGPGDRQAHLDSDGLGWLLAVEDAFHIILRC